MRRFTLLLAVLLFGLVVACGGDDDDSVEQSVSSPSGSPDVSTGSSSGGTDSDSSTAPGRFDSDFCTPDNMDSVFQGLDFTTDLDNIEAQLGELSDALDGWVDQAPDELEDDVAVLVEALHGMFELFEEYDFNFIAVGTNAADDSRLAALESSEFQAATDRLSAYCGYDVDPQPTTDPGFSGGGGAAGGGFTAGALPDNFPEELVPPSSEIRFGGDIGLGLSGQFTSTATVEEILEFYENELGEPTTVTSEFTLWSVFSANKLTTVTVSGTDGNLEIVVVIASS